MATAKPIYFRPTQSILAAALMLALATTPAAAAETLIYSGTLQDGGKPAEGQYDLRVQLYDAATGGQALGPAITLNAVKVENGRFHVPITLQQALPPQGSVWLQAQLQPPGNSGFQPLSGRQEISASTGGTCWETTGNPLLGANGTIGITDSTSTFLNLRNDNTNLYLRRNGGMEMGPSIAAGIGAVALGYTAAAFGNNSLAAGFGSIAPSHAYSTVFADGSVADAFPSTAAHQFLVRAQGGFAINTNVPLGTLTVRRGGSAGVASPAGSTLTTESDSTNYVSLLAPTSAERGILFGDPSDAANGAIIFNPITVGVTNPAGLSFRTGGNNDRLKITSSGILLLNQQNDPSNADVGLRSASGGNADFFMNLRSSNGNLGVLRVAETGGDVSLQAQTGDLLLFTNSAGKFIRTNDRLGVSRAPASNALEVEGNASKTTATAWLANSDRRIKQAIVPIDDALATLRKVQPVSFEYTAAYRAAHPSIVDQRYVNVIAQDFATVFPDAVKPSGEYLPGAARTAANEILQVDTYPATITAIAAIQELDVTTTVQARELAALRRENSALRQRLDALEQRLLQR